MSVKQSAFQICKITMISFDNDCIIIIIINNNILFIHISYQSASSQMSRRCTARRELLQQTPIVRGNKPIHKNKHSARIRDTIEVSKNNNNVIILADYVFIIVQFSQGNYVFGSESAKSIRGLELQNGQN